MMINGYMIANGYLMPRDYAMAQNDGSIGMGTPDVCLDGHDSPTAIDEIDDTGLHDDK